jgi:hypothetical protein
MLSTHRTFFLIAFTFGVRALAFLNGCVGMFRSRSFDPLPFCSIYRYLSRVTRDYVPTYIAASIVASTPRSNGISLISSGPVSAFDPVTIRGAHKPADTFRLQPPLCPRLLARVVGMRPYLYPLYST